jgi:hypothetical protein
MKDLFTLYCPDKQSGRGEWEFRKHKGGMDVIDPNGRLVCWFSHEQANERFALPSFWRSVKNINFTTDKGALIEFEPDRQDVRIVKKYLDDALLAGGIEGLRRFRNRALLCIAGGLALTSLCVALTVLVDPAFAGPDHGRRRVSRSFIVGGIFGIGLLGWGVFSLFRFLGLLARYKKQEVEALDDPDLL